jgi:hypothetical protein
MHKFLIPALVVLALLPLLLLRGAHPRGIEAPVLMPAPAKGVQPMSVYVTPEQRERDFI